MDELEYQHYILYTMALQCNIFCVAVYNRKGLADSVQCLMWLMISYTLDSLGDL